MGVHDHLVPQQLLSWGIRQESFGMQRQLIILWALAACCKAKLTAGPCVHCMKTASCQMPDPGSDVKSKRSFHFGHLSHAFSSSD